MYLIVFISALLYCFLYLGIQNTWYFEDDAWVYYFVSLQKSPLDFFIDPTVIQSPIIQYLAGKNLTPGLYASFWFDHALSPQNPLVAYLHQGLSVALFITLLFVVIRPHVGTWLSLVAVGASLLLPSTVSVTHFLATRHYCESGILFLGSVLLLQRFPQKRAASVLAIALFLLGALFKEVFIPLSYLVLVAVFLMRKDYISFALTQLAAFGYAFFRWSMVGVSTDYPGSPSGIADLLSFMAKIPYFLTASTWGYGIFALVFLAWSLALYQDKKNTLLLFLWLGILALCLVPIIPASMALLQTQTTPGTWYRIFFVPGIALILGLLFALSLVKSTRYSVVFSAALLVLGMSSSRSSRKYWNDHKSLYAQEGKFYLTNPDVLVDSKVPAFWFIQGVDKYFNVNPSHYVTSQNSADEKLKLLEKYGGKIWSVNI